MARALKFPEDMGPKVSFYVKSLLEFSSLHILPHVRLCNQMQPSMCPPPLLNQLLFFFCSIPEVIHVRWAQQVLDRAAVTGELYIHVRGCDILA